MDYHANVEFFSVQVEGKISLEKFVLRWLICLTVIQLGEETRLCNLDIQAQDPTTPIEDINVVVAPWKKRINIGRFGRHEER